MHCQIAPVTKHNGVTILAFTIITDGAIDILWKIEKVVFLLLQHFL
jgi:hypothetical protein